MSKQEEELSKALNEAQEDVLSQEEMDATTGGSWINLSKSKCGDTTIVNTVAGCGCPSSPGTDGSGAEAVEP